MIETDAEASSCSGLIENFICLSLVCSRDLNFRYLGGHGSGRKENYYDDPELLVAFPYEKENPKAPLDQLRLETDSPLLFEYFWKAKKMFEQQNSHFDTIKGHGEFYGVARVGPYSFNDCYVAYRDNTKWCASVITNKKMPWAERKRYLFQNHAVSISERIGGGVISVKEAHYIAAIFNTPLVARYINASSDNRSFKIRPPIYLPLFDEGNELHLKISELGRMGSAMWNVNAVEVEKMYLELARRR